MLTVLRETSARITTPKSQNLSCRDAKMGYAVWGGVSEWEAWERLWNIFSLLFYMWPPGSPSVCGWHSSEERKKIAYGHKFCTSRHPPSTFNTPFHIMHSINLLVLPCRARSYTTSTTVSDGGSKMATGGLLFAMP